MTETDPWRCVYASVVGVAHLADGRDCEDACAVERLVLPEFDSALLLVAADGAGSAAQGGMGAALACRTFLSAAATCLAATDPPDWTAELAIGLLDGVREALIQQAEQAELPLREFACTLLAAAVTAEQALFLQIGDGAIVIGAGEHYQPVFWPQSGEYANETRFVTDADAASQLQCTVLTEPVLEIALLTDGLQPLALHYQQRQAHTPFFQPIFQQLRASDAEPDSGATLTAALERFLASPAVNARTHDDKTLILASRL